MSKPALIVSRQTTNDGSVLVQASIEEASDDAVSPAVKPEDLYLADAGEGQNIRYMIKNNTSLFNIGIERGGASISVEQGQDMEVRPGDVLVMAGTGVFRRIEIPNSIDVSISLLRGLSVAFSPFQESRIPIQEDLKVDVVVDQLLRRDYRYLADSHNAAEVRDLAEKAIRVAKSMPSDWFEAAFVNQLSEGQQATQGAVPDKILDAIVHAFPRSVPAERFLIAIGLNELTAKKIVESPSGQLADAILDRLKGLDPDYYERLYNEFLVLDELVKEVPEMLIHRDRFFMELATIRYQDLRSLNPTYVKHGYVGNVFSRVQDQISSERLDNFLSDIGIDPKDFRLADDPGLNYGLIWCGLKSVEDTGEHTALLDALTSTNQLIRDHSDVFSTSEKIQAFRMGIIKSYVSSLSGDAAGPKDLGSTEKFMKDYLATQATKSIERDALIDEARRMDEAFRERTEKDREKAERK